MTRAMSEQDDSKIYARQNRVIHAARNQLGMSLDKCRDLAKEISGIASISSLSIRKRWELIETLKAKGARVLNPHLNFPDTQRDGRHSQPQETLSHVSSPSGGRSVGYLEEPEDVYPLRLAYWKKRFPRPRPGFASCEQLAWIEALWELDFNDGRAGTSIKGLRGFIHRQTKGLKNGPVSDLAFLRSNHVEGVLTPLKAKAKQNQSEKGIWQ